MTARSGNPISPSASLRSSTSRRGSFSSRFPPSRGVLGRRAWAWVMSGPRGRLWWVNIAQGRHRGGPRRSSPSRGLVVRDCSAARKIPPRRAPAPRRECASLSSRHNEVNKGLRPPESYGNFPHDTPGTVMTYLGSAMMPFPPFLTGIAM